MPNWPRHLAQGLALAAAVFVMAGPASALNGCGRWRMEPVPMPSNARCRSRWSARPNTTCAK